VAGKNTTSADGTSVARLDGPPTAPAAKLSPSAQGPASPPVLTEPRAGKLPRAVQGVRRLLAIALIVFAGIWAGSGRWHVCTQQAVQGATQTVTTCNAPTATDPAVLAILGLVFILLWQDISELGLPGGFTIKRRLEHQEQQTAKTQERQERLEDRLLLVQQQVTSASASASNANNIYVYTRGLPDAVDAKSAVFRGDKPADDGGGARVVPKPPPVAPPAPVAGSESDGRDGSEPGGEGEDRLHIAGGTDQPVADEEMSADEAEPETVAGDRLRVVDGEHEHELEELELIRLWARLERWVKIGDIWSRQRNSRIGSWPADLAWALQLPPSTLDGIARWRNIFADELTAVAAVRNAVAHGGAVWEGDLRNTLAAARRLLEIPEVEFEPAARAVGASV
jgi:hypothetical protein